MKVRTIQCDFDRLVYSDSCHSENRSLLIKWVNNQITNQENYNLCQTFISLVVFIFSPHDCFFKE